MPWLYISACFDHKRYVISRKKVDGKLEFSVSFNFDKSMSPQEVYKYKCYSILMAFFLKKFFIKKSLQITQEDIVLHDNVLILSKKDPYCYNPSIFMENRLHLFILRSDLFEFFAAVREFSAAVEFNDLFKSKCAMLMIAAATGKITNGRLFGRLDWKGLIGSFL
jgi:hypothetical protein